MKRLVSKVAGTLLLLAGGATGLGGCAGVSETSGGGGFGGSGSCVTPSCLPLAQIPPTWIAEIDPPSSSTAAVAFASAELANQSPILQTDSQVTVTATFTAPSNAPVPAKGTAIFTIPSPIAGRPPLTFQAPTGVSSSNVLTASLIVPLKMIGNHGTLTLVPLPPADQQNPPYTFSTVLGMTMQVAIATDNFTINGSLQTAAGQVPATTYVAQAFQGGALVSSAPPTQQSDGSFQLVIPSAVLDLAVPLTVQLTPQSTTDPWFISNPIAASNPLPAPFPMPILLSASTGGNAPTYFNVAVYGSTGTVDGAVVQAQTTVGSNTYGSTEFSRTATTGDGTGTTSPGMANLSLVPYLPYSFAIIPPANSPFVTSCSPSVPVSGGSAAASTAPALMPPFTLGLRAVLSGSVSAAGVPVTNVSVTATPGPDPVPTCTSTPGSPASGTTDANGRFTLYLDPGTYQLDYDPPAGSAATRLTEYGVTVGIDPITHAVDLSAAGLVQGKVLAPDMTPLPSATVRIYAPRCSGSACSAAGAPPPQLRAQAVTDANGFFRVAVQTNN